MDIHTLYALLFRFSRFRQKRMQRFAQTFSIDDTTTILDIGGTQGNWHYLTQRPCITLLNLDTNHDHNNYPVHIRFQAGNALHLTFPDHAFDIAFSNSVIEHVSTWENQQQFAQEIRRVSGRLWVQTPAREFFFEPHLLTPFVHWLPRNWQQKLLRHGTVWGWIKRPNATAVTATLQEIRLLTYAEMTALFPDCHIQTERWLGLPKAYIAIRV